MNIVFDIGMVLVTWDPRHLYRKIFDDEAKMEWFLANVCTNAWNLEQDRGRTFAEAVLEATARHPDHAAEIKAFDERWHEMVPGAIAGYVAGSRHRWRVGRASGRTRRPRGLVCSEAARNKDL